MPHCLGSVGGDAESLGDTFTVLRIDLGEESDLLLLNALSGVFEGSNNVVHEVSSVFLSHDLSEESTGLLEVVVLVDVLVSASLARNSLLRPGLSRVFTDVVHSVGLVVGLGTLVAVYVHGAVTLVVGHTSAVGAVDRDLVVVGSKSVSVSIRVREKSSLEHLVVGGLDSRNEVRGREGGLLSLSEVVLRVSVQSKLSNGNKRVVGMGPDLSDIENIKSVVLGILLRHDLNEERPSGEVSLFDRVEKIPGGVVRIFHGELSSLSSSEVLDSLVSLEVLLDEESLSLSVNPDKGVRGVSVHEPVSIGSSSI